MIVEAGWSTYLTICLLPGEPVSLSVPPGFLTNFEIVVEPNLAQTRQIKVLIQLIVTGLPGQHVSKKNENPTYLQSYLLLC